MYRDCLGTILAKCEGKVLAVNVDGRCLRVEMYWLEISVADLHDATLASKRAFCLEEVGGPARLQPTWYLRKRLV